MTSMNTRLRKIVICSVCWFVVCWSGHGQESATPSYSLPRIATASALPTPPPGISAAAWIPLGEKFAFVITKSAREAFETSAANQAVVTGYFMMFRQGRWVRVELDPAAARPFDATQ